MDIDELLFAQLDEYDELFVPQPVDFQSEEHVTVITINGQTYRKELARLEELPLQAPFKSIDYLRVVGGLGEIYWCYLHIDKEMDVLKAKYPTLFEAEVTRELSFTPGAAPERFKFKKPEYNIVGLVLYVVGDESPESCKKSCTNIWPQCVVGRKGAMRWETQGACANCFYNNDQTRCKLSQKYKSSEDYKLDEDKYTIN